ncbi:MAG TPA: aspartate kinase [Vicinamibacterales bacterium]|nr:aspartate kinase [Vicinamibacterales bacterium]
MKTSTTARRAAGALEVWKFGGASLADAPAIEKARGLIARHHGPLVVVASALGGVTDLLLDGAHQSAAGATGEGARAAAEFLRRHREVVRALLPPGGARRALLARVDRAAREYRDLCGAVGLLGHLAPRASDLLVSRGERMAATILAAALLRAGGVYVEASDLVATDGMHGQAATLLAQTTRRARRILRPLLANRHVAVVAGFIGQAPDGSVTTLGRGGSDLTATLLARALGARRVVLWKDVPGILTADPRVVPDARLIPQLHHREAAEVAHYGAKVLHPRSLIPIAGTRTVLRVRSFLDPSLPGTEVSARRVGRSSPVKALATVHGQAIVTVAGKGMVGMHGIAARTFAAVDAQRLSVSTIFQGSSESSIGFTLPEGEAARAVAGIRKAFREELASGLIDRISARPGMAVLAVVGDGMAGSPGVAARVFSALASGGINVVAIAQGASERNISFAVNGVDAAEAARRVHTAFRLSKIGGGRPEATPRTDVVLLGFGRVGRALADQIAAANGHAAVRVVGLLDRSGYVFDPRGMSRRRLLDLARKKDAGGLLASLGGQRAGASDALTFMASHAVSRPVVVDVTSEETGDLLRRALGHGFDIVLANKKPLAGSWDSYASLLSATVHPERRVRYEATVGAGLPIIDTHHKLVETGDRVLKIEGCVSGTLMYVVSEVSAGRPFSTAVREAVERGYAEPDPRDDLSGRDAARKALILARLLGYRGAAPKPDDLVPRALRSLPLSAFMKRLSTVDADWAARVQREAARGCVLRYVVSATSRGVSARLTAVPASTPVGALQGTRNLVAFTTRRYRTEPLVISGPGAGAQVTAAGILNDIYSLTTGSGL